MRVSGHFFETCMDVSRLLLFYQQGLMERKQQMKRLKASVLAAASLLATAPVFAEGVPVTAIVSFPLQAGMTTEQARDLYMTSAPQFQETDGLIRKYYLFDGEAAKGGGVYLWESRSAADALYTDEWKASLAERLGAEPNIQFFQSPVIVDNLTNEISATPATGE